MKNTKNGTKTQTLLSHTFNMFFRFLFVLLGRIVYSLTIDVKLMYLHQQHNALYTHCLCGTLRFPSRAIVSCTHTHGTECLYPAARPLWTAAQHEHVAAVWHIEGNRTIELRQMRQTRSDIRIQSIVC